MKKSFMLFVAVMLVMTAVLAGCGSKNNSETADSNTNKEAAEPTATPEQAEEFTMVLRHINVRDTAKNTLALLQDVVKQTEQEVPGLKFELDGVEDTVNRDVKLKAEMAAGTQPPIFNLFGGADTQNYSKAGRLLALNDIMAELNLTDAFFNLGEFTVDGKIYGLPDAGYIEGFFYNKKMFEDAGVQVPTTYDQLLAACEALKAKGITPIALGGGAGDGWAINMLNNSLFVGLGGPQLQEGLKSGQTKWTDPAMVEAFTKLKELKDREFIDPNVLGLKYAQGQAKFYTGQAAMLFDGSWAASAITGPDSQVADVAGFFRFPDIGGPGDGYINGGWSNGYGFSADLKDKQLEAAKAFIKNFYNLDNQKKQLITDSRIPAMKGIADIEGATPLVQSIGESQGSAKGAFPAFDALVQPKVKVTLETTMQELLGDKVTPEEAAEQMQKVQDEANAG